MLYLFTLWCSSFLYVDLRPISEYFFWVLCENGNNSLSHGAVVKNNSVETSSALKTVSDSAQAPNTVSQKNVLYGNCHSDFRFDSCNIDFKSGVV